MKRRQIEEQRKNENEVIAAARADWARFKAEVHAEERADWNVAGREYLTELPGTVPAGKVLVHAWSLFLQGCGPGKRRGYRVWLQQPDEAKLEPCGCRWEPSLGQHCRVRRSS
jgi:hypothetical protein